MTNDTAPTRQHRALRTTLITVGSVVLVAVLAWAAVSVAIAVAPRTDASTEITVAQPFTAIEIDTAAADVTVHRTDVEQPTLRFHQGSGDGNITFTHTVRSDGVLVLGVHRTTWFSWPFSFGTDPTTLEVSLPKSFESDPESITVDTTAGDLTMAGAFQTVSLHSTAGNVTLTGGAKDLDVSSTAGDIRAVDYALSGRLTSDSTAGDVSYRLSSVPTGVDVSSTAGDISFVVPKGDYRIVTHTTAGDVTQNADSSGESAHTYRFESTAGDIRISDR